jgi:hypothetical protein
VTKGGKAIPTIRSLVPLARMVARPLLPTPDGIWMVRDSPERCTRKHYPLCAVFAWKVAVPMGPPRFRNAYYNSSYITIALILLSQLSSVTTFIRKNHKHERFTISTANIGDLSRRTIQWIASQLLRRPLPRWQSQ